jgi:hypothetical protein
MSLKIDHIVLGAATLQQGIDYISQKFGIVVPKGGEHLQMGTHNCVMSLDGQCYFEIIAIAPHMERPGRPRWFGLDEPDQQARLSERPRILTWVVRTPDIRQTLDKCSDNFGEVVAMERGDLSWQLTIQSNGALSYDGLCPTLIEWPGDVPPYNILKDMGCQLSRIVLGSSAQTKLYKTLQEIGASDLIEWTSLISRQNEIKVEFSTPLGLVMLD